MEIIFVRCDLSFSGPKPPLSEIGGGAKFRLVFFFHQPNFKGFDV